MLHLCIVLGRRHWRSAPGIADDRLTLWLHWRHRGRSGIWLQNCALQLPMALLNQPGPNNLDARLLRRGIDVLTWHSVYSSLHWLLHLYLYMHWMLRRYYRFTVLGRGRRYAPGGADELGRPFVELTHKGMNKCDQESLVCRCLASGPI